MSVACAASAQTYNTAGTKCGTRFTVGVFEHPLEPSTPVDMLEANFGGQFILDGIDLNPVREGWTLRRDR